MSQIQGWYSNPGSSSGAEELLSTTFRHAKLLLRSIVKPQDYESLFPAGDSSQPTGTPEYTIDDVQKCLKDAERAYESRIGHSTEVFEMIQPITSGVASGTRTSLGKSRSKLRFWLTGLSEKVLYYGNIFDLLVQHHPEYVSLAWGTFKLVFTVRISFVLMSSLSIFEAIANNAEIASKLSKSICQIADLLSQHSLHLVLYPTSQMQTCVARLYAYILDFFLSAIEWYNANRFSHAVKSVLQPWDIKFRPQYEAIASESRLIKQLADSALKAEVRDTRLEVIQGTRHWDLIQHELVQIREDHKRSMSFMHDRFEAMQSLVQRKPFSYLLKCINTFLISLRARYEFNLVIDVHKEIRIDLASQGAALSRVHLTQMLSLPIWSSLPTSGESLQFCRSIRNRDRVFPRLSLPTIETLKSWALRDDGAVLFIDTYTLVVAKTFMINLVDLVLESHLPMIWALRYPDYWSHHSTPADIIRMLVLQAMQLRAGSLLRDQFPVTIEQLREAASLDDWITILDHFLRISGGAFIVLDADLLLHAMDHERSEVMEFMDALRRKLVGNIRIITSIASVGQSYVEELQQSNACVKIPLGVEGDWRAKGPRKRWRIRR